MATSYPNINGLEHSFSSIVLKVGAQRFFGATSINYGDSLTPGMSKGTATLPLGWTAGEWAADACSIEFNRRDADAILAALDPNGRVGYGRVPFPITVQYAEDGMPPVTDVLPICRITKVTNANAQGTDPSKVTFELQLLKPILRNGRAIERSLDNRETASV